MPESKFTPFGKEWKKEMMKWTKSNLIDFLAKNMKRETPINQKTLKREGWTFNNDIGPFICEKKLPNQNFLNSNDKETGITLVVHRMYNDQTFAVQFADGSKLNFVANTMEELKEFEGKIAFYDASF